MIRRRGFFKDESGDGIVEFALSAALLLTVIFGILECSLALYADHFVSNAARDATRYAMVRGSTWSGTSCATTATYDCEATSTDVTNFVKSMATGGIQSSNLTVTTTWTGLNAGGTNCVISGGTHGAGCMVVVKVSYPFGLTVPFVPNQNLMLISSSEVAISQ